MVYKVDVNVGTSVEKIISYLAESNKFNIFYNGKSLLIAYKKYSFYETNLYKKSENHLVVNRDTALFNLFNSFHEIRGHFVRMLYMSH